MVLSLHHGILPGVPVEQLEKLALTTGYGALELPPGIPSNLPVRMVNHLVISPEMTVGDVEDLFDAAEDVGATAVQVVIRMSRLHLLTAWHLAQGRVTLMVEPVSFYGPGLREIQDAASLLPGVHLCLDTWHLAASRVDPSYIASLPSALIGHVHLADGTALEGDGDRGCALGEGVVPIQSYLRAIKDTGYEGTYGVEILHPENPEAAASISALRARTMLAS